MIQLKPESLSPKDYPEVLRYNSTFEKSKREKETLQTLKKEHKLKLKQYAGELYNKYINDSPLSHSILRF